MTIEFYAKTRAGWHTHPDIRPFQFPGGEWDLKHSGDLNGDYAFHYAVLRGASMDDIAILGLWSDLLKGSVRYVFVPYLPAARADRGEPMGVSVYSRFLNAATNGGPVVAIDPHSGISMSRYGYPYTLDLAKVVVRSIAGRSGLSPYDAVIAPDKGAHDRAKLVGDAFGIPTYFATKTRDFETGKLTQFNAPAAWPEVYSGIETNRRYLVVDDICDGGGTFMGLASVLNVPRSRLDLWVTHGVFSGKAEQITSAYGNIYTTDSHPGARNEAVGAHVTALLPYFIEEVNLGN